jgi:hypothetical protein
MLRFAPYLIILALGAGGGLWLMHTVSENKALRLEVIDLNDALAVERAIAVLAKEAEGRAQLARADIAASNALMRDDLADIYKEGLGNDQIIDPRLANILNRSVCGSTDGPARPDFCPDPRGPTRPMPN